MLNSLVILPIILIVYMISLIKSIKAKDGIIKYFFLSSFYVYIFLVIAITIFPLPIDSKLIADRREIFVPHNNYIPFKSLINLLNSKNLLTIFRNVAGNVIMFMPLGVLAPILFKRVRSIKNIFMISLLCSLTIEFSQFIISYILTISYKVTDIDDIILNIIGGLLGFIVYKLSLVVLNKKVI